ncbi:TIGR03758 family integrating conjugative element protein [Pseudomonas sp. 21LCFQ02]|uniref:TIGR03758 family integrating conjugative element protein n=1 Tax=Pseudomonas sp. 21LCFQ02 TaxID=2957505 RepID=UPI00209B7E59|nr:TIGR03758 family integrating conjugative element protein [Pseudomonas sp. 21LCFQ02]MCO8166210.1 TIGR03758 family integrating conjugative element protein [Pseudomonas sp. 21LCFQ02]
MSMSAAQSAAFTAASGLTPSSGATFFVGLAFVIAALWLLWSLNSIYRGWATSNLDRNTAGASVVRLFIFFLTLSFFILS